MRTRNTWNGLIQRGIEYSGAMPFRTTLTTASATRSTCRRTGDGTFVCGNPSVTMKAGFTLVTRTPSGAVS